jgi:hypothetical protein
MTVTVLKWTQLAVAVASTFLAALIWPGVLAALPAAVGVVYIFAALGAIRDRRHAKWLAAVLSVLIAWLAVLAVVRADFDLRWPQRGTEGSLAWAVDSAGSPGSLDDSDALIAELERTRAAADYRHLAMLVLLVFVATAACAVVLLHVPAWSWLTSAPIRTPRGPDRSA